MGNTTIIITLLASFLLVGGCNSSRPEQQATVNQHMIKRPHVNINDSIERRTVPDDSLPPLPDIEDETFAPRTLIISYDTETGTAALDEAIKAYGAEIVYRYDNIHAVAICIPEGKDIHEAIAHFGKVPGVTAVNRDRKVRLM